MDGKGVESVASTDSGMAGVGDAGAGAGIDAASLAGVAHGGAEPSNSAAAPEGSVLWDDAAVEANGGAG